MPARRPRVVGSAGPFTALSLIVLLVFAPLARPVTAAPAAQIGASLKNEVVNTLVDARPASAAALGDIDLDGHLDLVAVVGRALRWYPNNRTGSPWSNADADRLVALLPRSMVVHELALGLLDADEYLDLAMATTRGVRLYLTGGATSPWSGLGTSEPVELEGGNVRAIQLGDVSGDRRIDLLAATGNAVWEYSNEGDPAAWAKSGGQSIAKLAGSEKALDIALGRLDADQRLDLVACGAGGCRYLLNAGGADLWAGEVQQLPVEPLPGGEENRKVQQVELGDIDRKANVDDTPLDIIIRLPVGVWTYLNRGDARDGAAWRATWIEGRDGLPIGANTFAIGDLDANSHLDVLLSTTKYGYLISLGPTGDTQLTPDIDDSASVILGDVDGDRDLDIVAAGERGVSLYTSLGLARPWWSRTQLVEHKYTQVHGLVLGEFDRADGTGQQTTASADLDLVIGTGRDLRYFTNAGPGKLFAGSSDGTVIATDLRVTALASGYLNNDAFPDLVVGTGNRGILAFYNTQTSPPFTAGQRAEVIDQAPRTAISSVALRDVNGDGRPDVVATSPTRGLTLHIYDGAGQWTMTPITSNVALAAQVADVDSDGDNDLLALITEDGPDPGQVPYLFRNEGEEVPWLKGRPGLRNNQLGAGANSSGEPGALGDVDGDGDLDLVSGSRLVLNDGTDRPFSRPIIVTTLTSRTPSWTVLDYVDGDSDLDLVHGAPDGLFYYPNRGVGAWTGTGGDIAIGGEGEVTALARGDIDQDGDLDLVVASEFMGVNQTSVYLNGLNNQAHLQDNSPPRVVVGQPTRLADPLSTTPVISIPFTLADPEDDRVREVRGYYSLDGGGSWLPATPREITPTLELTTTAEGEPYSFEWDLEKSGVVGASDNVVFRLVALPDLAPRPGRTAGPYQHASASAVTTPFSLTGMRVHVVYEGDDEPEAVVYRLVSTRQRGGQLTPPQRNGHAQLGTDHLGNLQGRGSSRADPRLPKVGNYLMAMKPISSTDTYTLYYTSAAVSRTGELDAQEIKAFGEQTLVISPSNKLLLFNLTVSVEWDSRGDERFHDQLEANFRRASELLYRWSSGQVALGDVTIYTARDRWDDAFVRIYATNRMRPSAAKGGIVTKPFSETVTIDNVERTIEYWRGQVRMGAVWNRYGEAGASLGDDWARTLAHELGHFALFLDDNYLGLDKNDLIVPVSSCPGPMSDPYIDGEFYPAGIKEKEEEKTQWEKNCGETLSDHETGRSDWETIVSHYDLTPPETYTTSDNPEVLPLAVTRVYLAPSTRNQGSPEEVSGPTQPPLETPVVLLARDGPEATRASPEARAYLFHAGRLIDLGSPTIDQIIARGAYPKDRVCVFDVGPQPNSGPRPLLGGCTEIDRGYKQLTLRELPGWRPDITVTPVLSTELKLEVRDITPGTYQARLYPTAGATLPTQTFTVTGTSFTTVLTSTHESPAFGGHIHFWAKDEREDAPLREAIVDFLVGGNPGGKYSHGSPRGNPGGKYSHGAPVLSADGQAILYSKEELPENQYFSLMASTVPVPPPPWATIVGRAYRLTVPPGFALENSSISIGYLAEDVPLGHESSIAAFFYDDKLQQWEPLANNHLDTARNEVSGPAKKAGVYALLASARLPLPNKGWNLAYFYPGATQPVTVALRHALQYFTTIYGYDPDDPSDPWKSYDKNSPPWANDLELLEHGQGYWISTTEAITLRVQPKGPEELAVGSGDPHIFAAPPATYFGALDPAVIPKATGGVSVTAKIDGEVCQSTSTRAEGGLIVFALDVPAVSGGDGRCIARGAELTIHVGACELPVVWDNSRHHDLSAQIAQDCRRVAP